MACFNDLGGIEPGNKAISKVLTALLWVCYPPPLPPITYSGTSLQCSWFFRTSMTCLSCRISSKSVHCLHAKEKHSLVQGGGKDGVLFVCYQAL